MENQPPGKLAIRKVSIVPQSNHLVAREIKPIIDDYDMSEYEEATQLNMEVMKTNQDNFRQQFLAQLRANAHRLAQEANHTFSQTLAEETAQLFGQ